jgi:hypothetical protein
MAGLALDRALLLTDSKQRQPAMAAEEGDPERAGLHRVSEGGARLQVRHAELLVSAEAAQNAGGALDDDERRLLQAERQRLEEELQQVRAKLAAAREQIGVLANAERGGRGGRRHRAGRT